MILAAVAMTFGTLTMAKGTGEIGSVGTLKVDKHSLAIMKLATYKAYMSELETAAKKVAKDNNEKFEIKCGDLETQVDYGPGYFTADQTCVLKRTGYGGTPDEDIIKINFVGVYAELDDCVDDANGNEICEEVYAIATISQEDISEE